MTKDEIRELVERVRAGMKITKVVATRSVRGRNGETQAGFTAEYLPEEGKTLREAIVANCLLSREADIAAHRNAVVGGNLTPEQGVEAIAAIKKGYDRILVQALTEVESHD